MTSIDPVATPELASVDPAPTGTADTGAASTGTTPTGAAPTASGSALRPLDPIDRAIAEVAAGRPIVVVDDEDRENEGDLVMAAEFATPEWMGFLIRYTSGVVCAPMTAERAAFMKLPPMVSANEDPKGTAYTVSCDAVAGTSTGISAADRATTVRVLADPGATPADISRPGHVFPLVAKDGGVRERDGHTEAGVEFSRLAGAHPVSVIAELVHDDGSMMRLPALLDFGAEHGLAVVSIEDLRAWLDARDAENTALPTAEAPAITRPDGAPSALPTATGGTPVTLPSAFGDFRARAWTVEGVEHLTIEREVRGASAADVGRPDDAGRPEEVEAQTAPLVRLHSECLTGDVFGSHRCDCGEQLHVALERIAAEGGVLVYLRNHEGRGIGLANKLAAYALQEQGRDTVDANLDLGFADDERSYEAAAAILHELGIDRVRLMTNNPAKAEALTALGLAVTENVPVEVPARPENARYLETKRVRMRHTLSAPRGTASGTVSTTTHQELSQELSERKVS
ncbi:3,4-dihydroxy-2-butanone-4-phosphate synthase [Brevibacterium samyangense]|uniref:GTP cyclohydrolase-2 n=1 Tax=Brevibacterium samyangense TaxID=366888 RepID=A0ABN2TK61_9MICO